LRGVAIFAKACFGHPSPSKRQKLNATANAFVPVSEGSIYNFNQQAYEQLAEFETISKANLVAPPCLHVDHSLSDFIRKRGDEKLPFFIDQPLCLILCHDS
jgi:hypothetical protein